MICHSGLIPKGDLRGEGERGVGEEICERVLVGEVGDYIGL